MTIENKTQNISEFETWFHAFLFMAALSIILLSARFLIGSVFNVAFEVFVFYVPTLLLFIVLLSVKRKRSKQK